MAKRRDRMAGGVLAAAIAWSLLGGAGAAAQVAPVDTTAAAVDLGDTTALVPGAADTAAVDTGGPAPTVWGPGERMEFSIDYGMVNAGDGTVEVVGLTDHEGRQAYHIQSKANSNRFFSAFYKVRDKIISYIDVESLRSLYFYKRLREGDYKKTVEYDIDHEANEVRYGDGRTFETQPGTQDVLSAFFYVRNLDLAPGRNYSVPAHSSRRTYDLRVIVHGRERVEVPAGTYDCFVVEPVLEGEGLFQHEGKITIYVSDDAWRVPVLIKTKVPVGSIDVRLTGYRPGRPLVPLDFTEQR